MLSLYSQSSLRLSHLGIHLPPSRLKTILPSLKLKGCTNLESASLAPLYMLTLGTAYQVFNATFPSSLSLLRFLTCGTLMPVHQYLRADGRHRKFQVQELKAVQKKRLNMGTMRKIPNLTARTPAARHPSQVIGNRIRKEEVPPLVRADRAREAGA